MCPQVVLITDTQFDLRVLARNLRKAEQAGNMRLYESFLREPVEIIFAVAQQEHFSGSIHVIEMLPLADPAEELAIRRCLSTESPGPHYRRIEHPPSRRKGALMREKTAKQRYKK